MDFRKGEISHSLEAHKNQVSSLSFSPHGNYFVSNDISGQSVFWKFNVNSPRSQQESFDIDKMKKSFLNLDQIPNESHPSPRVVISGSPKYIENKVSLTSFTNPKTVRPPQNHCKLEEINFNKENTKQNSTQPGEKERNARFMEAKNLQIEYLLENKGDAIYSGQLNSRLQNVENSILGIFKTMNLVEKMTSQNTDQLKHIIQLCNSKGII